MRRATCRQAYSPNSCGRLSEPVGGRKQRTSFRRSGPEADLLEPPLPGGRSSPSTAPLPNGYVARGFDLGYGHEFRFWLVSADPNLPRHDQSTVQTGRSDGFRPPYATERTLRWRRRDRRSWPRLRHFHGDLARAPGDRARLRLWLRSGRLGCRCPTCPPPIRRGEASQLCGEHDLNPQAVSRMCAGGGAVGTVGALTAPMIGRFIELM
jgi:hypothetical protein